MPAPASGSVHRPLAFVVLAAILATAVFGCHRRHDVQAAPAVTSTDTTVVVRQPDHPDRPDYDRRNRDRRRY